MSSQNLVALSLALCLASCHLVPPGVRDIFTPVPGAAPATAAADSRISASATAAPASEPVSVPADEPAACSTAGFRVCARARGVFFGRSFGREAQLAVEIERTYKGPAGSSIEVKDVQVYGASGTLGAEELTGSHLLGRVQDLEAAPWTMVLKSPWSGSQTYSMLVRCVFDETVDGRTTHGLVAEQWGVYEGIVPSPRINLQTENGEGGSGRLLGRATFSENSPPAQALYDVQVSWSGRATAVRVYAAPGEGYPPQDEEHLVGETAPIAGQTTWQGFELRGPYDGSDVYSLLVAIHFPDGGIVHEGGTFHGVQGSRGTSVFWSSEAATGSTPASATDVRP